MINEEPFIFITARLKSQRLKNKIILPIGKLNLISLLILNLKKEFKSKNIVLITSSYLKDKPLIKIAKKNKINFFCGEPNDVLKRIYQASKKFKLKNVLSCTADNPFVSSKYAKKLYEHHIKYNYDFSTNDLLPLGTFCYCLKVDALKKVLNIKGTSFTEIWGDYFRKLKIFNCGKYKKIPQKYQIPKLRLTVDYIEDYNLINTIYTLSNKKVPSFDDIMSIISKNKSLINLNKNLVQKKLNKLVLKKKFNNLLK